MNKNISKIKELMENGDIETARKESLDYAKEIIIGVESKKISIYDADDRFTEAFAKLHLEKLGEKVLTIYHLGMLLHDHGKPWGSTIGDLKVLLT